MVVHPNSSRKEGPVVTLLEQSASQCCYITIKEVGLVFYQSSCDYGPLLQAQEASPGTERPSLLSFRLHAEMLPLRQTTL